MVLVLQDNLFLWRKSSSTGQESRTHSTFTTAVCKSWNVSDKYTWDNAGDLKLLSMDQTLSEDNRSD